MKRILDIWKKSTDGKLSVGLFVAGAVLAIVGTFAAVGPEQSWPLAAWGAGLIVGAGVPKLPEVFSK